MIVLSAEQKALLQVMETTKQHLFITGRAGTGKSVLLRHFREHTAKRVVIAAPTGIAALNVRGQTIHSLFRLPPQLHRHGKLALNSRVCTLLKRIDTLVIDEISMVRADLLDAIDERLREAFGKDIAFGGVQVVMFGDAYQLPPVVEESLIQYFEVVHSGYFFFNALVWKKVDFKIYELTQVFRQKDGIFKDVLNAVRDGSIVDGQVEQLNARYGVEMPAAGTVTLAPTNALVTTINQKQLDQLPGKVHQYQAIITGEMKKSVFPTEENLLLKKGAQVVLLKNDKDGRWVNGSVAVIEKLLKDRIDVRVNDIVYSLERETWEEVVYSYDRDTQKVEAVVTSSFTQYPVRLAWALTIHKSQGQTYESVALDLTTATFAPGQLYVALSRCVSLDGLYLKLPVRRGHIIVDPKVKEFMSRCETITAEEVVTDAIREEMVVVAVPAPAIHHDEIDGKIAFTSVDTHLHHDEIKQLNHDVNEMAAIQYSAIGREKPEPGVTNSKKEKKGRTKKERKSTKGRKTKSGAVREPMQLSLDIRVINTLNAMGVNKSQLFENLLQQYDPFLKIWASLHYEFDHDENESE